MPTTRRSRTFAAAADDIWAILRDPHHQSRWWPGVRRVEGVERDRFTQVLYTARGRPVRIDLTLTVLEPGRALSWEQEVTGTPFERHLAEAVTEVRLEPEGEVDAGHDRAAVAAARDVSGRRVDAEAGDGQAARARAREPRAAARLIGAGRAPRRPALAA